MFANILNTFYSFFPIVFISKHALHNWFYTLIENWCRNTQSVRNKVIHKNYVFSVTSRSRTFRFGRNKELVLPNKQTQFCKNVLFLRDTREKCFLRYWEPATPGYIKEFVTLFMISSPNFWFDLLGCCGRYHGVVRNQHNWQIDDVIPNLTIVNTVTTTIKKEHLYLIKARQNYVSKWLLFNTK